MGNRIKANILQGTQYDSLEELYFSWWLTELQDLGYIDRFVAQPEPFDLSYRVSYDWTKETQLKTKLKVE